MNEARTVTLESQDEALHLYGKHDANLKMIRDSLGVRLIARGDTIQMEGGAELVDQAERVFVQLRQLLKINGRVQPEDVRTALAVVTQSSGRGAGNLGVTDLGRSLRPRTDGQARYVQAMRDNDVIISVGPAGTGKTFLAVGMAVNLLRQGSAKRLVLVRPAVEAGERLGFLPGDMAAKVNPYLRPLFDALNDLMEPEQVRRYVDGDVIEIAPLAFMRGRTLNQAVVILDEAQNTTVAQMKMFLTRLGHNSKMIVTGDLTQNDLPDRVKSGLDDAVQRLKGVERIAIVYLDESDIVRHPLVQRIVRAYEEPAPRRRP